MKKIYDFLAEVKDDEIAHYTMVGYELMNTLSENGHVARGVCSVDENSMLTDITERTKIVKTETAAAFTEDDGKTWTELDRDTIVSMNLWGFTASMMEALKERFPEFLKKTVVENPMKGEFFLPFVVGDLLAEKKADAKVLTSADKWFGVTYKEDKPVVVEAIAKLTSEGKYPSPLWN